VRSDVEERGRLQGIVVQNANPSPLLYDKQSRRIARGRCDEDGIGELVSDEM
jgi:hypothetical protein